MANTNAANFEEPTTIGAPAADLAELQQEALTQGRLSALPTIWQLDEPAVLKNAWIMIYGMLSGKLDCPSTADLGITPTGAVRKGYLSNFTRTIVECLRAEYSRQEIKLREGFINRLLQRAGALLTGALRICRFFNDIGEVPGTLTALLEPSVSAYQEVIDTLDDEYVKEASTTEKGEKGALTFKFKDHQRFAALNPERFHPSKKSQVNQMGRLKRERSPE